jgi:hypothetical protein
METDVALRILPGRRSPSILLIFAALVTQTVSAETVWTGAKITYTQPGTDPTQMANQDRLTPNVWLTRASSQGLFNAKTEGFFTHSVSPADTEWADGTTANYATLTYTDWNTWAKGVHLGPPTTVSVNAVVHLKSEDIYLDIKFTFWGGSLGGFAYERSTPGTVSAPTPAVSIINPTNNAVFAAPANVTISADATVSSGSVTNVQFFVGSTSLGSDNSAPFTMSSGELAAGSYAFTAVATAAGVSATSAVVNITVVSPVSVAQSSPSVSNGQFSFDYSVDPGLTYVVEASSNLVNWSAVLTNMSTTNPAHFTEPFVPGAPRFYRVGRAPNP